MSKESRNCAVCGRASQPIPSELPACAECLRSDSPAARAIAERAHRRAREAFGLPGSVPAAPDGVRCRLCANACAIPDGSAGFCGMRVAEGGAVRSVAEPPSAAAVTWYHDSLPTNCCADWVCPGGSGAGYPRWAHRRGPEIGYKNLAVFYEACNFDCLYCQNWHFRSRRKADFSSPEDLVRAVDERTSCICFFGGDPTPQLPHALRAAELALEKRRDILRICWETNGAMSEALLEKALDLSLRSGGCMKFDLKAWSEPLHRALCGPTNAATLRNFERAAARIRERPEPPPLVAATLLVPGYVDEDEVRPLARFIAGLDPEIPYVLLAFHPDFRFGDLPTTSRAQAERCLEAARSAGLRRVRLGNPHLLI